MNSMQLFLGSNTDLVRFNNNWQRVVAVVRIQQDRISDKLSANFSKPLLNRYYELCDLESSILTKYRGIQCSHDHHFNTVVMGRKSGAVAKVGKVDKMQVLNNCKDAELSEMLASFRSK